jgi:hypothetical protein
MIAQSWPVPVMEYESCEVRVTTLRLFLRRVFTLPPQRVVAMFPPLRMSGLKYIGSLPGV